MRQWNIPTNDKVSIEVQTDINLIHQPMLFDLDASSHRLALEQSNLSPLMLSQTDSQLLSFFRQEANFFRGLGGLQEVPQDEMRKRLLWIQQQIQGLEKRSLVIKGLDQSDYYKVVADLQGRLDKQLVINGNYEPKLQEAQAKINELQKQIQALRKSLILQENLKVQNEVYEEAFRKISDVVKDQRRMKEIEKTVSQTLAPLLNEYEVRVDSMLKSIQSVGRVANDSKYKVKGHVTGLLKNLEKLIKGTGEMTVQNVQKYVAEFLKEIEVSETFDQYESAKSYKSKYLDLEKKYNASISIFKSKFDTLLEQNPDLRNQLDMSIFDVLARQGVNFYNFSDVITIQGSDSGSRTVQYLKQEERTTKLLGLLIGQFKGLLKSFPQLRQRLNPQLLQVLTLEVFEDAIALQEIERIFQVVKYKTEIVKVENVYSYNNQTHLKTIFHLKIMIKALLDQLTKIKEKTGVTLEIDEGLLGMVRSQIIDYVNPDDILRVFRSCPKILEVEKIVQRDLTRFEGMLTEVHPLTVESVKIVQTVVERPVILKEQIGVIIQKGIPLIAIHQKPVEIVIERPVEINVLKEVIVQRIIYDQKIQEIQVLVEVPMIQQQIKEVEVTSIKQVVVQVPQILREQVPIVTKDRTKQIVQVQRFQQKLVQVVREITNIKQVKITQQVPIQIIKYIQVQKIVNNFVNIPQIVQIKEQVPITITNTIERPVQVIETIEKIIQVTHIQERIVQVPVQHTVTIIQEVPVPYKETQTVFVKGDREEVLVQVERIVQKPLIQEVIKIKQIQRERIVPLWVRQQKPMIVEINLPYIQNQIEIITCHIEKIVPFKEEIPVEIIKQIPVPIICQKEIIKPVRIIVERFIEKMVQVPRVVEIQKIVEKIVVVPRIIENIVYVPQIVEKIVEREVEILKIVELERNVPYFINKEVQVMVQQKVEVPIQKLVIQQVEREKMVVSTIHTQVIREIEVERLVPVEVIREKEVRVVQERIVDRLLTVHQTEIHQKQVVLPIKHEVPVEIIQEKAVQTRKIVETILQIPQVVTRNTVLYQTREVIEVKEILVEKPFQTIKQVVYTNTNNYIEVRPQYRDLIKEVLVKEVEKIEVVKPEPYIVEKIVTVTNVEQEAVQIKVEKGMPYRVDNLVILQKPVVVEVVRQVPKVVNVQKVVTLRTIHQNLKQVPLQGRQRIVTLQKIRPEVTQMTQQVIRVLVQHREKEILQQVAVIQEQIQTIEVPSKPIVVQEIKEIFQRVYQPLLLQKVVQRVTLLPQIVEVLRHIHQITEERVDGLGLGIAAFGVDVQVHTSDYITLCMNLRKGLQGILPSLNRSTTPEARGQVTAIQELIRTLGDLIRFPNIVQIPKEVEKIVERQKIVLVPTRDQESLQREIASNTLIQKLLEELKRIRKTGVELRFEEDIMNSFFVQLKGIENLKGKLSEFGTMVTDRFRSLGSWTDKHSVMLNSFLEERFLMAGLVRQSNSSMIRLKSQLENSQTSQRKLQTVASKLNILNLSFKNCLDSVFQHLSRSRNGQSIRSAMSEIQSTLSLVDTTSIGNKGQVTSSFQRVQMQKKIRVLQQQIQSFRGGQNERAKYLDGQQKTLSQELKALTSQNNRLRMAIQENSLEEASRNRAVMTNRIQDLSRLLEQQKQEHDSMIKRLRDQFERKVADRTKDNRVITSTIDRSQEEEKLREVVRQLELRIRQLEEELTTIKNKEARMTVDLQRRTSQNQEMKKRFTQRDTKVSSVSEGTNAQEERLRFTLRDQEGKIKELKDQLSKSSADQVKFSANASRYQSELQHSQVEQSRLSSELRKQSEQMEGMKTKLSESQLYNSDRQSFTSNSKKTTQGDLFRSPDVRQGSVNPDTPAAQLKITSPDIDYSSSSGTNQESKTIAYKTLTLAELIASQQLKDTVISRIAIKIIEKIQENMTQGKFYLYTPSSIRLVNYSAEALNNLEIVLGTPIDVNGSADRNYLAPQVLQGGAANEKSCVFNMGVIWDEMFHQETFFKTEADVTSATVEYKVRNAKLNPIFKNVLFEMLAKNILKRPHIEEVKKRLSLQKYIVSQEKRM